ncbi:MAG TPA: cupin domain-containing protein [Candidatus Dormibacteraeota bacterium]|nr:cupin domain-containing protein [Candidatus Dormibacteraeota bacterium]
MVSAAVHRIFVGMTAVATLVGWLQLAPAFGFPVTDAQAMLDRALGPQREEDWAGWLLFLLGMALFAAVYLLGVESRRRSAWVGPAYGVAAWLLTGAVVMPLLAAIQGNPPVGDVASDPMRATFFMSNLGAGAAVEALIGWLLFGVALAAGRSLRAPAAGLAAAAVVAVGAGALAFWVPRSIASFGDRVSGQGTLAQLPPGPVYISVLELPQPAGAVLGPHRHVGGVVVDFYGSSVLRVPGDGLREVTAGKVAFIPPLELHSHENPGPVPWAIGLAVLMLAPLATWTWRHTWQFAAAVLIVASVATGNPFTNHWYVIGVRPVADRKAAMPVPSGHRVYQSASLVGLAAGPYTERVTERVLAKDQSLVLSGPAAVILVSGDASLATGVESETLKPGSGATIALGARESLRAGASGCELLLVELMSTSG